MKGKNYRFILAALCLLLRENAQAYWDHVEIVEGRLGYYSTTTEQPVRTAFYYNIIDVSDAHSAGYNGLGVSIGIIDSSLEPVTPGIFHLYS
jgi:subtilase family serine protease